MLCYYACKVKKNVVQQFPPPVPPCCLLCYFTTQQSWVYPGEKRCDFSLVNLNSFFGLQQEYCREKNARCVALWLLL